MLNWVANCINREQRVVAATLENKGSWRGERFIPSAEGGGENPLAMMSLIRMSISSWRRAASTQGRDAAQARFRAYSLEGESFVALKLGK